MQVMENRGHLKQLFFAGLLGLMLTACGGSEDKPAEESHEGHAQMEHQEATTKSTDPKDNKGIGPVKELQLAAIDEAMVKEGQTLFEDNCSACHKVSERYIGPAVEGVTNRRSAEWVMNMILNPEQMVKEDPIAKELLAEYMAPMANQSLTEEQARKILEYFRTLE